MKIKDEHIDHKTRDPEKLFRQYDNYNAFLELKIILATIRIRSYECGRAKLVTDEKKLRNHYLKPFENVNYDIQYNNRTSENDHPPNFERS